MTTNNSTNTPQLALDGQFVAGRTGLLPTIAQFINGTGINVTFDPVTGNMRIDCTVSTGVTSVSGTANRITSTGGTTPVIDISASYVGQATITTLGTVSTGTWSATNIGLTKGGTNASLTASNGGIVWSNASQMQILSGTSTASQMLQSGSSATPAWSTATWPASTTINQILYSSAADTVAGITTASNGTLVTSSAGVPSILAGPGTTGQILQSNAAAAPSFSTASYPSTTTINQILYSSSANTVTGLATANKSVLTTNATGVPTLVSLTDGQIVVGSTSGAPAAATLTAGAGISITNASNSITITSTDAGFSTVVVNATTQTLAKETQYIANNNATPVTFTLPVNANVGDTFVILGLGAAGWNIAQNTGQSINVSSHTSTIGGGGSVDSSAASDQIEIVCAITDTVFIAKNVQGFLNVV